jgi:hypothetical protein
MMKKFILALIVLLFSTTVFSQVGANSKTVLKYFILGYDSKESLIKKGVDINDANTTDYPDNVTIVRLDEYSFKKDVVLLFVDNTLYSVRYYVYNDNQYQRYLNILYKKYNVLHFNGEYSWFNEYINIEYEIGDDNERESFIHFDKILLKKYPQFKDF